MQRPTPNLTGTEVEVVEGFLEFHRATFESKCAGLTAEQAATRSVPPSAMSLLGLIRHLADTERAWFDRIAVRPRTPLYDGGEDADFDGAVGTQACLDAAWRDWRAAVDVSRETLAGADWDAVIEHPAHGTMNVRWIIVHMVEEYARHNGHADLLRETVDGATGV